MNGEAFKRCDWVPKAMIPTAVPTLLTMLDIFLLAWEPTATATALFFVLPASRGDSTPHRWRTAQMAHRTVLWAMRRSEASGEAARAGPLKSFIQGQDIPF